MEDGAKGGCLGSLWSVLPGVLQCLLDTVPSSSGTTPSSGCWSLVFTARLWLETCRSQNSSTVSGVLEVPQPSYLSGTSAMMLGFVSTRGQWMTSC